MVNLNVALEQGRNTFGYEINHSFLELIKERFDVEYSIRQVERILRDLKFGYAKPYTIYSKMPEDAEELLKKNSKE